MNLELGAIIGYIVGVAGVVSALGGLVINWRTSRAKASKDEVDALRGIIAELRAERDEDRATIGVMQTRITDLERENGELNKKVEAQNKCISELKTENERLQRQQKASLL